MGWIKKGTELTKNQKAVAILVKVIVALIIIGVVGYCEMQFIQVIAVSLPPGFGKVFTLIGAIATGLSILTLIIAEAYWFSRGIQMVVGWIFSFLEVVIMVLNVLLSFEIAKHAALTDFWLIWENLCPATPVLAAVFWVLIFNLDEGQKTRHDEREMQDDIAASDREHRMATHRAKMQLKASYLDSTAKYLEEYANDPSVQAALKAGALALATEELKNLTGIILPRHQKQELPEPNTADSTPPPEPEKPTQPEPPTKKSEIIVQTGPLDRTIFSPLAAAPDQKSRNGAS